MNPYHLTGNLKFLRYQNSQGKVIPLHHAFKTLALSSFSRVTAVVLPVLFVALLWLFLPYILDFWSGIFEFWTQRIYGASVEFEAKTLFGQSLYIPYPVLDAQLPSHFLVWCNLILCILFFLLSFIVPTRAMPVTYLLRTILLIQASASINRFLSPDSFPYTMKLYMLDAIIECVYMLLLLPVLLGMVYYIFDFSVWRKCWLTVMLVAYYIFFIPCQYMLHAYIIHEYSLLFMPLMYIFFGVLLDVLTFVGIYSYGMSWKSHPTALQGRGV